MWGIAVLCGNLKLETSSGMHAPQVGATLPAAGIAMRYPNSAGSQCWVHHRAACWTCMRICAACEQAIGNAKLLAAAITTEVIDAPCCHRALHRLGTVRADVCVQSWRCCVGPYSTLLGRWMDGIHFLTGSNFICSFLFAQARGAAKFWNLEGNMSSLLLRTSFSWLDNWCFRSCNGFLVLGKRKSRGWLGIGWFCSILRWTCASQSLLRNSFPSLLDNAHVANSFAQRLYSCCTQRCGTLADGSLDCGHMTCVAGLCTVLTGRLLLETDWELLLWLAFLTCCARPMSTGFCLAS